MGVGCMWLPELPGLSDWLETSLKNESTNDTAVGVPAQVTIDFLHLYSQ
jgi:hypothetical protein